MRLRFVLCASAVCFPLQTLSEIRQLLADRGLRPKHRLGQNFLHDKNQLARLIEAAQISPGDLVLEVGPGTGTLTEAMLEAGAEVIACEIDEGMATIVADGLARWTAPQAGLFLIHGDAIKRRHLNPEIVDRLGGRPFKLIANLPYQIASPLISTLLIEHPNCGGQFVTIQREVADRLMAVPGGKDYGPMSVIVQGLAQVRRIAVLSPSCFWPEPEVTSAMVAIVPKEITERVSLENARELARFITTLFTKRRKQLGGIIGRTHAAWPALETQGITPDLRPEALSAAQLIELWKLAPDARR